MIITDMSNLEYHANPGLSASGLKELARSPAHYVASRETPRIETPAMKFGTAVHCAILEPERFETSYIGVDLDRRAKEHKALAAELEDSGTTVLSSAELMAVYAMRDAVFAHKTARDLFTDGQAETSVFAEIDGVACKCRPDWLREDGLIIDLKTSLTANPKEIGRICANFSYHLQQAHYQLVCQAAGLPPSRFLFVFVEKERPYGVSAHLLSDSAMELGANQHARLLALYRNCLASGQWPGYNEDICITSLPAWVGYQEDY